MEVEATIRYTRPPFMFGSLDYIGSIHGLDFSVCVTNEMTLNASTLNFMYKFKHQNMLNCYFSNSKEVVYPIYTCRFSEHIEHLQRTENILPVMFFQIPKHSSVSTYEQVGYVPTIFRLYIRSIFKLLCFAHSKGYFTMGFNLSNLVVMDNVVKCRFSWDFLVDQNERFARAQRDFDNLYKTIRFEIFGGFPIPKDMIRWLNLLRVPNRDPKREFMMRNHLALLPPSTRILLFCNFHKRKSLVSNFCFSKCLNIMRVRDWIHRINSAEFGPFYVCLNNPNAYYSNSSDSLIRFTRNFVVHFGEHNLFTTEENAELIDALVMGVFGELTLFHEELSLYSVHGGPAVTYFADMDSEVDL